MPVHVNICSRGGKTRMEGGVSLSFLASRKREAIEPGRVSEDGWIALSVN